jgi:hypothetical protein
VQVGSIGHDHDFRIDSDYIQFLLDVVSWQYNVDISWGMDGNTSGFELVVRNIPNQEDIEDMMDMASMWEREILDMEYQFGEIHGIKVPDPQDLQIDFAEVKMPMSQEEKNKKWKFELENNLATMADYWKAQNPDIKEEQIEEKYREIQEEKRKMAEIKREVQEGTTLEDIFNEEE